MKGMNEMNAIINRHIARLLTDLEDAGCPVLFRDTVKGRLQWLRADLTNERNGDTHERDDQDGNGNR
jgi:hypothetical protein